MITIQLTRGYQAIVDDEDSHLADYSWYAQCDPCGQVYARRWDGSIDGKQVPKRLHREVLGITDPAVIVDHIDGDGLNCRRSNLRIASSAENARNLGRPRRDNRTSPYLGVTMRHGKYRARIRHDGRLIQIGTFATAKEANDARIAFETKLWGAPLRAERWAR